MKNKTKKNTDRQPPQKLPYTPFYPKSKRDKEIEEEIKVRSKLLKKMKTLDNLEVGDILVNVLGEECKILGICGEVYFVSKTNEFDVYSGGYAREEIKNRTSWVLKDSEELEPKVKKAIKLLEEKGYKVEK